MESRVRAAPGAGSVSHLAGDIAVPGHSNGRGLGKERAACGQRVGRGRRADAVGTIAGNQRINRRQGRCRGRRGQGRKFFSGGLVSQTGSGQQAV